MRALTVLWVLCLLGLSHGAARAADDCLDPQKAFRFTARIVDAHTIEVGFDVAPGYYLYREAFRVTATGATLGVPEMPQGKVKFDETFQTNLETYRGVLRVRIPAEAMSRFRVGVVSQGCADRGLCYPPMSSAAEFELPRAAGDVGMVRLIAVSGDPLRAAAAAVPMSGGRAIGLQGGARFQLTFSSVGQ